MMRPSSPYVNDSEEFSEEKNSEACESSMDETDYSSTFISNPEQNSRDLRSEPYNSGLSSDSSHSFERNFTQGQSQSMNELSLNKSSYTFNSSHHSNDASLASLEQSLANIGAHINQSSNKHNLAFFSDDGNNVFDDRNISVSSVPASSIVSTEHQKLPIKSKTTSEQSLVQKTRALSIDESFHGSTVESIESRNDTQSGLDRDIDIDNSDKEQQRIAKLNQSTPWKQLRTPSGMNNIPNLKPYDQNNLSTANLSRIEVLNKQITGYKVQIRFFKQFLQDLIDKSGNDSQLDVQQLTNIQENLAFLSPSKPKLLAKSPLHLKLESDHKALSKEYDEIYKLNEDLYAHLEDFEQQLTTKDGSIKSSREELENYIGMANGIIRSLIDSSDGQYVKNDLLNALNDPSMKTKLHAIGQYSSQAPLKNGDQTIEDIMKILIGLQDQFGDSERDVYRIKNELKKEIEDSNAVRKNYQVMHTKFNQLCRLLDEEETSGRKQELEKLRLENENLANTNEDIESKLDEYRKTINDLQQQINEKENPHGDVDSDEILRVYKQFNTLQNDYNQQTERFNKLQEDSSKTISSLADELKARQDEIFSLKRAKTNENSNLASEKELSLKAEKTRLYHRVEALDKDKVALQTTNRNLSEKITALTLEGEESKRKSDELSKLLNVFEYQYNNLAQYDLQKFKKLLKSFNKIADDMSLKEPKRKIETLEKQEFYTTDDVENFRDLHKSVFDYFTRAVDIIVNDHVKLLLKDNETSMNQERYVKKLHARIDELSLMNDSRSDESYTMTSPRTKLRIEELTDRWKRERETRSYENEQAKRRLRELEEENERLRQELASVL